MDSITLRLQPDTIESLSGEADAHDVSRSEYVRNIIRSRHELERLRDEYERLQADHEQEIEDLREEYEERIADLERENERVRNEKRLILEQREENTELVNTFERQQSLAERKAEAGLLTKTKWALFGMDRDE